MISSIKNVTTLVSLLKDYGIKDIVMAPGGSNIPIIHLIESDAFFNCYSMVDERGLVYFAMGISQQKRCPVACVVTSGTAVSNFLPGITEAFYRDVPIVAITADKNQNYQGQLETQKIEQYGIFGECCRKSVNLPVIRSEEDQWLCELKINEALIELDHHGKGPVQINIPVEGDISSYKNIEFPKCKKIDLIKSASDELFSFYTSKRIRSFEKIMIVVGQDIIFTEDDIECIEEFSRNFNVVISADHIANLHCHGAINTYPVTETKRNIEKSLLPSLVISIGNNIASYDLKYILRKCEGLEHWQIDESGRVRDEFHHLTAVFECSIHDFFSSIKIDKGQNLYLKNWENEISSIKIENLPYSSFFIAEELSKVIPENSVLHLAILNSTRLMQYFALQKNVRVYSNFGALGIDGCLSTFMGQAAVSDQLAFCLIGDLSFFYDMNAASTIHRSNNIRIIMLNNAGAGEFYFTLGKEKIPTIDRNIGAINNRTARGWVESLGYLYFSVHNANEAHEVISSLSQKSDKPIFVEVFLDIEKDAKTTRELYDRNHIKNAKESTLDFARSILGENLLDKALRLYHGFRAGWEKYNE